MYVFDIETNAIRFQDPDWWLSLETIHCLAIICRTTGKRYLFRDTDPASVDGTIEDGLRLLMDATHNGVYIGGQNVHGFDIPALQYAYPWFKPDRNFVRDSLVESEMWYPSDDMKKLDFAAERKRGKGKWIEQRLFGRHSVEAWGARLGCPKDDFSKRMKALGLDPWGELPDEYAKEREDYCVQDVVTNIKMFDYFEEKFDYEAGKLAVWLENRVAPILLRQKQWGVAFDVQAAGKLHAKLEKRSAELATELREKYFSPFYMRDGKAVVPKKTLNYKDKLRPDLTAGATYTKVKLKEFNPGSRQHIYTRLMRLYKWKPTTLTDSGEPKVDETVLQSLNYPPCPLLIEYLTVEKRLGQLVSGNEAWLKHERDGRIHGTVKQNGTRTTRASHVKPNLGQVPKPKDHVPYGKECRALFGASKGRKQVGSDLSGIELRALGHYLARYDGGAYALESVEGDVHERAREATDFNSRDNVKTAEYAFLYGAQNPKLGTIVLDDMTPEQRKELGRVTPQVLAKLGGSLRTKLQRGIKGLEPLVKACEKAYERGWMRALDGRKISVPAKHSALNTLLQHLGGELSKVWMVLVDDALIAEGYNPANQWYVTEDFQAIQILYVHDELQYDAVASIAEHVGQICVEQSTLAGEFLNLRVRVDATYQIGNNWCETH